MLPGLWRCQPDLVLDILGILVRPIGLVVLLGVWGALVLFNHRWERRVWLLLRALTLQAVLIWVLLLLAAVLANNPTGVITGGEYLAIIISWVTVARHLREEARATTGAAPTPERPWVTAFKRLREEVRTKWGVALKVERPEPPMESSDQTATSHPYRGSMTVDRPASTALARWIIALRKACELPWVALGLTILGTAAMVASTVVPATASSSSPALYLLPAAGAWTLVVLLHRSTSKGRADSGPSTARSWARRVFAVISVIVASWTLGLSITSLFARDSLWLVPGRVAAWVFAIKTAPLATDECLVYRVGRYGGRGWSMRSYASDPAYSELYARGTSALPDIERGLLRAIDSGDAEQQENLVIVLKLTTRWPEGDFIVRRWATATSVPRGQAFARKWLLCIEKGRRNLIGSNRTDWDCNPI